MPYEDRPFIAWDGEGINLLGDGKPQSYVLFGSSEGHIMDKRGLSTFQLLDHIIETGIAHPNAFHVGFAFSYDSNMIIKQLHPKSLEILHKKGSVRVSKKDGSTYQLTFTPGKMFRVTRYGKKYSRGTNNNDKVTVTIQDTFSFFACSFIKAYTDLVGPVPDIITTGKGNRATFKIEELEEVYKYWQVEVRMLRQLAEVLRDRMYGAGLRIKDWYGPGALASYAMKQNGVKQHMKVSPDEVREASRYAYAGGRFELFKVGRIKGPVYSLDINSAYPAAIAQLPSLSEGVWTHVQFDRRPERLARFGVYYLKCQIAVGFKREPGPLFFRDHHHEISYPWLTEGWYWTPEANEALKLPGVEIVEGWEYRGAQSLPFAYISDMYSQRSKWKQQGNSSQLALKLCMNSHYGKMAQRVGWNPETNRIPPWHQLEWAGWVTSWTRSMLYRLMIQIPFSALVAVETDGIFTTVNPELLGLAINAGLGGWSCEKYDEVIYIQSGLAWLRQGDKWTAKRRGLDKDSFTLSDAHSYVEALQARKAWPDYTGRTTRFVGLGAALSSNAPVRVRHCVWETKDRSISTGLQGKRIHISSECDACTEDLPASERAHDLVVRSLSGVNTSKSTPHYIPWESKDRESDERAVSLQSQQKEMDEGLISYVN